MTKPLNIKIPKETTLQQFKQIIQNWLDKITEESIKMSEITFNFYSFIENSNKIIRQYLIFDIIFSYLYLNNYSNSTDLIQAKNANDKDEKSLMEQFSIKDNSVLIIEIKGKND